MTSDRTARLRTVLEAEEELYLEMRDLLTLEREQLVRLESAALEDTVRRKEALAEEGRLLEESRTRVVREIAAELDLAGDTPTLSQLCAAIGDPDEGLGALHSRLVALIGAVRELLRANELFAGESLTRVQGTLSLLGRLLPDTPTYGPGGTKSEPFSSGRLLQRTA